MAFEYVLYADESIGRGKYYSDFFGGLLVTSKHIETLVSILNQHKLNQNLHNEVKWQRVTTNYLEKYQSLMRVFSHL